MVKQNEIWLQGELQGEQHRANTSVIVHVWTDGVIHAITVSRGLGAGMLFRQVRVPADLAYQVLQARSTEEEQAAARAVLLYMGEMELAQSNGPCKGAKWTGQKVASLFARSGLSSPAACLG